MKIINKLLWKISPLLIICGRIGYIFLFLYGQKRSIIEQRSVDLKGDPIPWYTYPALEYIYQFDLSKLDIFEYGSGNSSIFWGKRANKVISIEDNNEWFNYVNNAKLDNMTIYLRQDKDGYINSIKEHNRKFNIIIIDGKWRTSCARVAVNYLRDGGIIIFDNTDWFLKASIILRNSGFYQIDFNGFGPINDYSWTTSIFINRSTGMKININSPKPIGGKRDCCDDE